jgi:hypothetical protein
MECKRRRDDVAARQPRPQKTVVEQCRMLPPKATRCHGEHGCVFVDARYGDVRCQSRDLCGECARPDAQINDGVKRAHSGR